ncbi:VIT1/CCC1 family protein [bacterium]|nr:VIT1/CCC1 family protein [bacterium]
MEAKLMKAALAAQRIEITEYHVYAKLAERCKDEKNAAVLRSIGEAEKAHAAFWKGKTGRDMAPESLRVLWYVLLARVLGLTFVLKVMERREGTGSKRYELLGEAIPEAKKIGQEESEHEKALLGMLDEERLQYIGSIVLGLNDALVELTGALAGFSLALPDTRLITIAGLVTGISAAFSMAASDFLSSRAEGDPRAGRSALYTGVTYLITVLLMILPFLLLSNAFVSLAITMGIVIVIILSFNYYLSVAKDLNFLRRFLEMTAISMGVAAFSFFLGYALKALFGISA